MGRWIMPKKKVFKVTDSISKKITMPEITFPAPITPTTIDDLQDQIDDITDDIENKYYTEYVFDKYDYFISTKPFYFYFEIPLGTVEIISARVSFEVKDYRNSSLTDSRYAITGDSEARPIITFYVSEDKGCKFGSAYGRYETDMRYIDISGDLTGEGIKIIKFTTDNDVCVSARIFLKLKVTKIESLGRPEIKTLPATSIASYSAILNGDIIKVGSGNVIDRSTGEITLINTCTKRGFKYATTKADTNNKSETGSFVKGKYNLYIHDLNSETDYYFRAYADNPLKVFGEYLKFTTTVAVCRLISDDSSTDRIYKHYDVSSNISEYFSSPSIDSRGLAYDGTNLISADFYTDKIYKHSGISSTISESFDAADPCGLTYDGTNLISSYINEWKIRIHSGISPTILETFASPATSVAGLTYDGTNLVSIDNYSTTIYKHDGISSTILESFDSPDNEPVGLAYDGVNLISSDYNSNKIYKHDGISSTILESFDSPDNTVQGLTYKNN